MKQKNTQFIQYQDAKTVGKPYGSTMFVYVQTFENQTPFNYTIKSLSGKVFNFKVTLNTNTQIAYISSKEDIRDEYFSYRLDSEDDEIGFFSNGKNPFHFHVRKDTVNTDKSFDFELVAFFTGEKNILKQYDIELARKKQAIIDEQEEKNKKEKEIEKQRVLKEEQELKNFLDKSKERSEILKSIKTFEEKTNFLLNNYNYEKTELTEIKNFSAVSIDGFSVFEYLTKDGIVYKLSNFEQLSQPVKIKESDRMEALSNSII